MKPASCDVRALIGAFADGELPGVDRLRVSVHLDRCEECSRELDAITSVGTALRHAAANWQAPELSGLASGVVARVRAESAQSWRGLFDRAIQDWRFALVGAGSIAATFVSTLLVSAIVWEGPARQRDDSLAARMRNLGSYSGVMMVVASDDGGPLQAMLLDNGGGRDSFAPSFRMNPTTAVFLAKIADVVSRFGTTTNPAGSMGEADRRETAALMDEMTRFEVGDSPRPASGLLVHELHLVTPVVTVRGL